MRTPFGSREMSMIENPRTGEQIKFKVRTPELLVIDTVWTRPGHRAAEHVHPEMEECFEVIEGRAAFRIAGEERVASAGEVVVVSPGTPHLAWNPTDGPVRLRITMRPALRWAEFTERLFGGESPANLLSEFSREVALPATVRERSTRDR
ncbi:MAG TPA: cupin domain-containing protein [Candidatus Acidoferrales bacterium]|nr:cupin domain-containing protein [Candidatus Acidoferrales bacterium]